MSRPKDAFLGLKTSCLSRCCLVIHSEYVDTHKYGHISDIQSRSRLGPLFLKIKGNWQQVTAERHCFFKISLKSQLEIPLSIKNLEVGIKRRPTLKKVSILPGTQCRILKLTLTRIVEYIFLNK